MTAGRRRLFLLGLCGIVLILGGLELVRLDSLDRQCVVAP